jgi:cleavage stimulation factor subunit 3
MKEEEDIEIDGEPTDLRKRFLEREARGKAVVERRQPELNELLTSVGVVWNMYIRCMRRSEVSLFSSDLNCAVPDLQCQQGLRAARLTFSQARKSAYISWHVFEASGTSSRTCRGDEAYRSMYIHSFDGISLQ